MRSLYSLALRVALACLIGSPKAHAQEDAQDKYMEVRVDKVINACLEKGLCGDELAVGMESAKASALVMRAWKVRDAKLFLGNEPSALRDDVQRRMDMTRSIDYLTIDIEVESVKDSEAIVFSRQRFSRLLQLPDGKTRRRITGMTHREIWEKTESGWKLKGFTEQDPTARWEDEN